MYRLHGFSQSGNTYKVALALQALGLDWQPVHLSFDDFLAGATRAADWREGMSVMGEVPLLDTPDGRRLSQSGAILLELARRHGALGGRDADEAYEVQRWLFFDNHKFTSYLATQRFLKSFAPTAPEPAVTHWLAGRVQAAFSVLEQHLQGRDWVVGDGPTVADCSLAGYVYFPAEETGVDIDAAWPAIAAWRRRLAATLPGWREPYAMLPGAPRPPLR
jgi:glutathione S-transferase